ncbi:MAG: hypothetical protein Dbin4_03083, partial [Alphaproteobacteria bacterium]|nr:hypothetical protein [Alphaproteobacteria bacterium]
MSDPEIIGDYEAAIKNMEAVTGTTAAAYRRLCDTRNAMIRRIITKLGVGEKIVSSSGSTGMLTKACLHGDALVIWLAVSDDKRLMDYADVRAAREI